MKPQTATATESTKAENEAKQLSSDEITLVGDEVLNYMLGTIQQNLKRIPFFSDKEYDVHPLYKYVIQELIKHSLAKENSNEEGEDNIPSISIGIESLDTSQL